MTSRLQTLSTAKNLLPNDAYESIDLICEIFKVAGLTIINHAGKVSHSNKKDGSPVTEIDKQVERQIISSFLNKYPNIPIFGEEGEYSNDLPELCWLIDPIDGTSSFIKNQPNFTSMGVLIYKDQAVASVIYNPSTKTLYTAKLGMGAFRDSLRLNIKDNKPSKKILCKSIHYQKLSSFLEESNIECVNIPSGAGAGFMAIIDGLIDARVQLHSGGYLHDYAPGALIVKEAGGKLIPILEKKYTYRSRSFIACCPYLEKPIIKKLLEIRQLEDSKNISF